jgi:hypothetical protein
VKRADAVLDERSEVKKFSDRKKAVARIWKAIQPLAGSAQPSEPEAVER